MNSFNRSTARKYFFDYNVENPLDEEERELVFLNTQREFRKTFQSSFTRFYGSHSSVTLHRQRSDYRNKLESRKDNSLKVERLIENINLYDLSKYTIPEYRKLAEEGFVSRRMTQLRNLISNIRESEILESLSKLKNKDKILEIINEVHEYHWDISPKTMEQLESKCQ